MLDRERVDTYIFFLFILKTVKDEAFLKVTLSNAIHLKLRRKHAQCIYINKMSNLQNLGTEFSSKEVKKDQNNTLFSKFIQKFRRKWSLQDKTKPFIKHFFSSNFYRPSRIFNWKIEPYLFLPGLLFSVHCPNGGIISISKPDSISLLKILVT